MPLFSRGALCLGWRASHLAISCFFAFYLFVTIFLAKGGLGGKSAELWLTCLPHTYTLEALKGEG